MAHRTLIPRAYQLEAATEAINKNTVINICTGGGKTLIAVIVVNKFISQSNKAICFLVPSRALVAQQASYLQKNCNDKLGTPLRVAELCGQELENWNQTSWTDAMARNDILVGTPEVFRRALVEKAFISPIQFSLIVFDECHNAVGNSPMASIMRDAVLRLPECNRPRILGLTASFVSGSTSSSAKILKKRAEMEILFQANICSPVIPVVENELVDKFTFITYPDDNLDQHMATVKSTVLKVLSVIPSKLFPDCDKWVEKGYNVFASLGAKGLRYWLKEGIIVQLDAKAGELEKRHDAPSLKSGRRIREGLDKTRDCLNVDVLPGIPLPEYSEQVLALLALLDQLKANDALNKSNPPLGVPTAELATFKGIIFVEQVALTYPLAHIINTHFEALENAGNKQCSNCLKSRAPTQPVSLPVSGVGSMLDNVRTKNMDSFRSGLSPVLISTSALEEGIDVPDCSFVIRYDAFSTTKSHIQGSGRARCKNAQIFYFKNDPSLERTKAQTMDGIAKDKKLNMSDTELKNVLNSSRIRTVASSVVYPFFPTPTPQPNGVVAKAGGEVNIFNCLQIFYEYVTRVMRQSCDPAVLFDVTEEIVRTIPVEVTRYLISMIYPSPKGIQLVECEEIDLFWGPTQVEDVVLPAELLKRLTTFDIAKRRAVYVIVIRLSQEGLLTESNEPSAAALAECQAACPAFTMENKIKLTHRYSKTP